MRVSAFDDPISFTSEYSYREWAIEYFNLREIAQGSPLVGRLHIDSMPVGDDLLFGGPFLVEGNVLYAPLFVRKFCISGFKLCRIDLRTRHYEFITKIQPLIFLDRIEGAMIFYFEDIEKGSVKSVYIDG